MAAPPTSTTSPWCTLADLPSKVSDGKYELDLAAGGEVEDWIQVASDILFEFTRHRWPGATTKTIRPMVYGFSQLPTNETIGTWVHHRRGTTQTSDGVSQIDLPNRPIVSIAEVLIDGDVVPAERYRVDDYRYLVYLPTAGVTRTAWPSWQDLDADVTEDGTFQVEYVHGTAPPVGGVKACARLATELAISASPKLAGQSQLPERVSSVTRQGVSAQVLSPSDLFDDGKTGISMVDMWIASVNQGQDKRRGRVRRLGAPRHRRTTG